ncbi:MAG: hypothetical protein KKG59_01875 [Nanoarchaeota archaeon]|nr:hypothetical protein [Nanoarchaeota archaeon]
MASYGGHSYIQYDSSTGLFSTPASYMFGALGIATDSQGNIFVGDDSNGQISKFQPDGTLIYTTTAQVGSEIRGVVVDSDDNVWGVHRSAEQISKNLGSDGTGLGTWPSGHAPYTYSDAAGQGLAAAVTSGTWTVVFDSEAMDTQFDYVTWSEDVPEDTSLSVKVRSSDDQVAWSPWEVAGLAETLVSTPNARYLQIEVHMQTTGENTPVLHSMTVMATCAGEPIPFMMGGPELMTEISEPTLPRVGGGLAEDRVGTVNEAPEVGMMMAMGGGEMMLPEVDNPCDSASVTGQCDFLPFGSLPPFVEDTINTQGTIINPECGNVLILTSGDPNDADMELSTDRMNPGCGLNPDGFDTQDCVIIEGYMAPEDSVVLAISSEWYEYVGSIYTDWMQLGGILNISINDWENDSVTLLPQYGPFESGAVTLATLAQGTSVDLRIADSGDGIYDTAFIIVPNSCFEEPPQGVYCGNGELDPGEECDDGNNDPGDGCDENCLLEEEAECGNGILEFGEECDDGNLEPGDGCDEFCMWEMDCHNVTTEKNVTWITQNTPIHITCNDPEPHPVDHAVLSHRYRTSDDCQEWGPWGDWIIVNEGEIYFEEDSCHQHEVKCIDAVGNVGEPIIEYDVVDTVPPVTTDELLEPYFTQEVCYNESNETECYWEEYIDSASTVQLTAVDPDPHPIGLKEIKYMVTLVENELCAMPDLNCAPMHDYEDDWTLYEEPFPIDEESCHLIEFYSEDLLGNKEAIGSRCVFVDKSGPVIEKEYIGPYFEDMGVEWINSLTEIHMSAYDPEPHPSGLDVLEYRISLVDDENCWESELCAEAEGTGDWTDVEGYAMIPEESCHLIEIHATDMVEKESWHNQCVFVENTPPVPAKEVGEPNELLSQNFVWNYYEEIFGTCNIEEGVDCWGVTLLTPISMVCDDQDPHPVGHETVCFEYDLDGIDKTEEICGDYSGDYDLRGDGYCCVDSEIDPFYFNDISEHRLSYYCLDALENVGEVDTEYFKVDETAFEIQLNHKWNLISTPVQLIDDSIEAVFEDVAENMISVMTYDAVEDEWYIYTPDGIPNDYLTEMVPGDGYWVLMDGDDMLTIGGSLMRPGQLPPSKPLKGDAWNLIGYWGAEGLEGYYGPNDGGDEAWCHMISLGDDLWDLTFTSMYSYWEPYNPNVWIPFNRYDRMDPGAGYWVFPTQDGTFVPNTICD